MAVRLDNRQDDFETEFAALLASKREVTVDVADTVASILADVRARGDAAVLELTARFDDLAADSMDALAVSGAEIDAALDDANIGRFCETLHGFTDKSQFLIITHNKRTISNADTVFGVTMPEKGVSTLISMRFSKETNSPEMATGDSQQPF